MLDFIGTANRRFRFVDRFRALTRGTRAAVERDIEEGFPHLPAGCDITLDRESRAAVLANVRQSLASTWNGLATDLAALGNVRLPVFLKEAALEPEDLYARAGRSFLALKHAAGLRTGDAPEGDAARALARLLHVDDDARLDTWRAWLRDPTPPAADATNPLLLMLFAVLGFLRRPVSEMHEAFGEVWSNPDLREELSDLLDMLADRARRPTWAIERSPFRVHATYSRDEISAGLLQVRRGKLLRTQGGVFKCEDAFADVFYVEVDKDPSHYTPTTLYNDYPISPTRFHWESQSATRADGETGKRYQGNAPPGWRTFLFVRKAKNDARGFTMPYTFLGSVSYVSHEAERPMKIIWELARAMPPELFADLKIAAG